jgi:hypothetical protein
MRKDCTFAVPRTRSCAALCRVALAPLSVALLLSIPAASGAQGCPCSTPSIEQAVAQASVIIVGKVLSTTSAPATGGMVKQGGQWRSSGDAVSVTRVTMQVDAAAKGPVEKFTTISTPDLCGTAFSVGASYLVFATRNEAGLWTDACRGNASGAAVPGRLAEVRRVLGKPKR